MTPRLVFVAGPGGVGKTTVAAALARTATRRGRRVLRASLEDGAAALTEYLALELPGPIARRIAASPLYARIVAGTPGLRELMAVGKIGHEARRRAHHDPAWDLVVVDTPGGDALVEALGMPAAAAGAFGGRVRVEAERLLGELRDPGWTRVVLVTRAEAPAIDATLALGAALTALGVGVGPVVVNAVEPAPAGIEALAALEAPALRFARAAARSVERSRRQIARLPAPVVELPLGPGGPDLDRIGAELERRLP